MTQDTAQPHLNAEVLDPDEWFKHYGRDALYARLAADGDQ